MLVLELKAVLIPSRSQRERLHIEYERRIDWTARWDASRTTNLDLCLGTDPLGLPTRPHEDLTISAMENRRMAI